jgi:CheY-like chemotaxis protein
VIKHTIQIRQDQKVLVVEDNEDRIAWFDERLRSGTTVYARTPQQAIDALDKERYDVIFLDHDAGTIMSDPIDNFQPVAHKLRAQNYTGTVIIHSLSYHGAMKLQSIMHNGIIHAFGTFELNKRRY